MKTRVVCCSLLFASWVFLLAGCLQAEPIPVRNFKIQELLMDLSVMPKGWYVSYPPHTYPENRGQWESISIQLDAQSPTLYSTQHTLFRYHTKDTAAWEYRDQVQGAFGVALLVKPWRVPSQLPYASPIADQYRFECAEMKVYNVQTACVAMAQYDEYVSIFSTHMDPNLMTFADVERILKAIDENMARHLGKSKP